jgi:hypothetical protein
VACKKETVSKEHVWECHVPCEDIFCPCRCHKEKEVTAPDEMNEKLALEMANDFAGAMYTQDQHMFAKGYLKCLDQERARAKVLLGHLTHYGTHVDYCIRLYSEAGEPTPDGGYRVKFKGKWYQEKPIDETPKCTCGFDDVLAEYLGERKGE